MPPGPGSGRPTWRHWKRNDFDRLPGEAYLLGFLRLYAGALGLAPDEALRRYRGLVPPRTEPVPVVPLDRPAGSARGKLRPRLAAVAILAVLGLVLALVLSHFIKPLAGAGEDVAATRLGTVAAGVSQPAAVETAPAISGVAPAPNPASALVAVAVPPAAKVALAAAPHSWPLPNGGGVLKVEALAPCRVQIVIDTRSPRDYHLPAGAVLKWPVRDSLTLKMVEPGRLRCWLDGRLLTVLERQGLSLEPSTARD